MRSITPQELTIRVQGRTAWQAVRAWKSMGRSWVQLSSVFGGLPPVQLQWGWLKLSPGFMKLIDCVDLLTVDSLHRPVYAAHTVFQGLLQCQCQCPLKPITWRGQVCST